MTFHSYGYADELDRHDSAPSPGELAEDAFLTRKDAERRRRAEKDAGCICSTIGSPLPCEVAEECPVHDHLSDGYRERHARRSGLAPEGASYEEAF